MRSAMTVQCSTSPREVGNTMPCETAPTRWPARPTRWRPLETDGGACTWITRSTAPMSMPSSRELVATTQARRPALRSSSICARRVLLTEPWWAQAMIGASVPSTPLEAAEAIITWAGWTTGSSGAPRSAAFSSLRWAVSRSALCRELTKQMVERCPRTSSRIRRSIGGHIDRRTAPGPRSPAGSTTRSCVMSLTGTSRCRSQVLAAAGSTTCTGRSPPRKRATRSGGRTVADRPMRWKSPSRCIADRRSRLSARWAPRLVPAREWISSTITVSRSRSVPAARLESMRKSDSGVVMRICGGCAASDRRSAAGVSPERTATVTSGTGRPSRAAVAAMPRSGAARLRSTSTASALRGET